MRTQLAHIMPEIALQWGIRPQIPWPHGLITLPLVAKLSCIDATDLVITFIGKSVAVFSSKAPRIEMQVVYFGYPVLSHGKEDSNLWDTVFTK